MRLPIVLLLSGTLLAGGNALAEDDFARTGGFVGGGPAGGFNETDLEDELKDSVGVDGRIGYRFHPHFAVEAQVTYLHNLGDTVGGANLDFETLTGTANLKGYLLPGRVQPYALLGVGGTWANTQSEVAGVKRSDPNAVFTARGGAGIDLYLTEDVLLYTEASYIMLTGQYDLDGMIPVVLGAQFRF